jgi:uncharacterized protein
MKKKKTTTHFSAHNAPEGGYSAGQQPTERIISIDSRQGPRGPTGPTGSGASFEPNVTHYFESTTSLESGDSLISDEELNAINKFYKDNPLLDGSAEKFFHEQRKHNLINNYQFDTNSPWIQTYSGLRFNPLNPNPDSILIQDIAHSLSMQCRFSGHIKHFYSVAQHSVLVSYLCDSADALWGLLHDATEAYLVDLPSPLKRSGFFDNFKSAEGILMNAVCKRFELPLVEPPSVKKADRQMLCTEQRDLLSVHRSDWKVEMTPLPFKIEALSQREAKDLFMKRFYELMGHEGAYEHYLHYEYNDK